MGTNHKILLAIDGVVNLALGVLLLFFPAGMADVLGLPPANDNFYPVILGAVIFGIGIALVLERYGAPFRIRGLGIGGAIAINLCGGGALIVWLLTMPLNFPFRGQAILWGVGVLVVGLGLVEMRSVLTRQG